MSMIKEFRDFAMRGNVIDLAIGVVIGTAFGAITSSLVKDVIMPPIGAITGNIDFTDLRVVLVPATEGNDAVTLNYGTFIQTVVNFLIIAWAMFFVVRAMNNLKRKQVEEPEKAPPPPRQEMLLEEIRDLLKDKK